MAYPDRYCFLCKRKCGGEGGMDFFNFCENKSCARYGLYIASNIEHPEPPENTPKKIVFMNAPIITSEGNFKYQKVDISDLKVMLIAEPDIERLSAIGHQTTSDILTELFGFSIPLNRIQYKQEIGDYCIIFKLNGRPEEGKILSREDIENIGYQFYVLEKV